MAEHHNIEPVFDENSRILILGSFPSVKSREQRFFYGHPQNRFWRVMAEVFGEPVPETVAEKKAFLLRNRIAVWDVIKQCDITGSGDSTIKNAVPNDISPILQCADIQNIFCNGQTSYRLYKKFMERETGIPARLLPSTSPANARCGMARLFEEWQVIAEK